ncbi:hypothetical protein CTEN210_02015 [Chaetoceros tenuissimus]|uniref:Peptidase S1 domain-containing protein n=1 Tax=Chaetoceros tenuissimus TaxID=426638 RepID=A0AAD3H093_9STRA|nr:hypothetical protein CTEN210_02015 [Chaetoceros tenuissimus]
MRILNIYQAISVLAILVGSSNAATSLDKNAFNIGKTAKIVGGSNAAAGSYPWYTALYKPVRDSFTGEIIQYEFYCGANLISENYVLTAAHCTPAKGDTVFVGALCPSDTMNCGQFYDMALVENVIIHPEYDRSLTYDLAHDFALIELDQAVTNIAPVRIDNGDFAPNYENGKKLYAAGLGLVQVETDYTNSQIATKLQEVELDYVSGEICQDESGLSILHRSTICAWDATKRSDACSGDSGGPLYDESNDVLVGITSYGDPLCVSTTPGVYARISDQFDWIQFNVCLDDKNADLCALDFKEDTSIPEDENWCEDSEVEIMISADQYPEELSWYFTDLLKLDTIALPLEEFEGNQKHSAKLCVSVDEGNCFRFDLNDYIGDGIETSGDDYTVTFNGETVNTETVFDSYRTSILFPAENCAAESVCGLVKYKLRIVTGTIRSFDELIIAIIANENDQQMYPYTFSSLLPNTEYEYNIDLCDGTYTIASQDLGYTQLYLYDSFGDIILRETDLNGRFFSSYREAVISGSSNLRTSLVLITLLATGAILLL